MQPWYGTERQAMCDIGPWPRIEQFTARWKMLGFENQRLEVHSNADCMSLGLRHFQETLRSLVAICSIVDPLLDCIYPCQSLTARKIRWSTAWGSVVDVASGICEKKMERHVAENQDHCVRSM